MRLAKDADVVVLLLGESASMSGEAQARTDIGIPAPQMALAEAVAATGKPIVVLLRHGRALALTGAVKAAPAIMATWFLGSETGNAIADLVFGDYAPQGRLPVSFPQASGQEPFYYNHRRTGRPQLTDDKNYKARYREVTDEPLYPFGHGLTYSSVAYSPTSVGTATMSWAGSVTVTATITNTGKRRCHEVAQLYINDKVASLTQPVRALKGDQASRSRSGASRDRQLHPVACRSRLRPSRPQDLRRARHVRHLDRAVGDRRHFGNLRLGARGIGRVILLTTRLFLPRQNSFK